MHRDTLQALIGEELQQREEEGCAVQAYRSRYESNILTSGQLLELYNDLMVLTVSLDFPYLEPSGLPEIQAERPTALEPGYLKSKLTLTDGQWQDKFLGAWQGRMSGCALGKPFETGPYIFGTDAQPGWKNVQLWFEGADAWPISGYTPGESRARQEWGLHVNSYSSHRENIRFMEADDDINYTVLGLMLLEQKGLTFDSWDIGWLWHEYLPYGRVYTAEARAYLNYGQLLAGITKSRPEDLEAKKEWVRTYQNPYREWIGAQIRADGLAYAAAGQPELAAELAWRDASFSHVKNGIYGEMFMAAVIAAAFVENDNLRLVEIGLSQIPNRCRLASDIKKAVEIAQTSRDQLELVENIWDNFKHYHPIHTNNNAALVIASLIHAGNDFEKAITTAVLGGWDTDCNGATIGSIMGAKLGAAQLPQHWIEPLHDTVYTNIAGFNRLAISECARRSYKVFRRLQSASVKED